MRKLFLLLFVLLSVTVRAVIIDGIYYSFYDDKTATVTSPSSNYYSGSVEIPSEVVYNDIIYSVKYIGEKAFYLCSGLTSITIPNSVTSIDERAFSGCRGLTAVTIPNSVTYIGNHAFEDCRNLTSITIPNSVTYIGYSAFEECERLISIDIPNNVTSIRKNAFKGCEGLTYVTIPNSVTAIEDFAFNECRNLTSVTIPNSVTLIGSSAFSSCSSLTLVNIPNSVTLIDAAAFKNCINLTSVTIPNSVITIGSSAFYYCNNLTSVNIPNSVTFIGNSAFAYCSSLTSVSIPNSLTTIEENTFANCTNLTSVTIPKSIKSIPYRFLYYCKSLKDVYCYIEEVPNTAADAFYGSNYENATLHVPHSAVNEYKSISPWSKFGSIVGMDGQGGGSEADRCEKPVIAYENGRLAYSCATDGVTFHSDITDTDIASYTNSEIQLGVTYNISVYASKAGYEDSDVTTATLCWIDVEPKMEGVTNGVATVRANAVMIQNNGNLLTVSGAPVGTEISVYSINGQKVGTATADSETTNVATTLQAGEIGIVKIGDRAVKFLVK